ncbi:ribonuclease P/MRP protein subunit POP5-like [Argonauta hians]
MRFKRRYILFEIESHFEFTSGDIINALVSAVNLAYGDYGKAVVQRHMHVKYSRGKTFIVVVPRKHCLMVQSAACFIKHISNKPASLRTQHAGGTIKSTKKVLLAQCYKTLPQLLLDCKTQEEREKVQASIVDSCSGKLSADIKSHQQKKTPKRATNPAS